jgi:hypothetical protein
MPSFFKQNFPTYERDLIGYTQKVGGDQSKVSMREAKYPILTSLNPLGQPFYILILMGIFIWLFKSS